MITSDDIQVGQEIWSVTMGKGTVMSISNDGVMIRHGGNLWRYNNRLVRSGCVHTDVVLRRDDIYLDLNPVDLEMKSMMEEIANVVKKYADSNW